MSQLAVCALRMARIYMVQTKEQYVFIHRVLLDYITAQVVDENNKTYLFFSGSRLLCACSILITTRPILSSPCMTSPT